MTTYGQIEIVETIFRQGSRILRPFQLAAKVKCRGYSHPLQRVMTDFGADSSFAEAAKKVKEHYGFTVPISTVQQTTEGHGAKMALCEELQDEVPKKAGPEYIIAQIDGSMIPIVETIRVVSDGKVEDRRKHRKLEWKEARLALARPKDSITPVYGVTLGGVDDAGDQLLHCSIRAGLTTQGRVHCVGDGATWIASQASRVFAEQGEFLLDFYHACEYLADAAEVCAPKNKTKWLDEQKENLKQSQITNLFNVLQQHPDFGKKKSSVTICYNYLKSRETQLDYKGAREAELPIGSGEIESGNRHVVQARLKLPGAWWKKKNARSMLVMRTVRSNGDWDSYWNASKNRHAA